MSVHYKFKSTLDYDTVSFDGLHISVCDLKKAIFHQKRIGKNTDFDLQVTNAQTKEDYTDDNALIAKNTSLIVSRVPLTVQQKRSWDRSETQALTNTKDESNLGHAIDLTRLDGSEDDKIRAMMSQSTQDYDPSNYIRIRGANQTGDLPPNYLCYKCHQPGHWIKNCPLGVNQEPIEIKKSTGIPRSFMVPVEGPLVPGAMMTPTGHYAVPAIDHQAYKEGKKERPPFFQDPEPAVEKPEIPEDLLCNICKDLLTDAVMIPCCGNSFCDECIRTFLLESEEHECPDCNEKDVSPETLIPNRFLRNAVMTFKNETGYAKQPIYRATAPTVSVEADKTEAPIPVAQPEQQEPPQETPVPQSKDSPPPQESPKTPICAVSVVKDTTLEPKVQSETLAKPIVEDETEVFAPLPPGTEPLLPIPSVTVAPVKDNEHNVPPSIGKKDCEREYVHDRRPRERRPSFNKEGQRESGENNRRIENLRSVNRRRSLSPRYSHRNEYPIHNTALPQLMNPSKEYRNLAPADSSRYIPNIDYEQDIRRPGEDRPGTPTVDEPHLHSQQSVNQGTLLPYPPGEDRIPPGPQQNYNQPPPNIVSHNQPLLPDPYMSHRMPMYPHQQNPHYGPPRYDRPYQQPRFRASHPPRNYNGPPRPMRGMHHQGYRGIQPPPQPMPQPQPSLPPPPLPVPGPIRTLHNGNNPGVIDDPLEAFERMLREKDERDRRLGKHRRRTRSRSRTRSYSRSRSRSFERRSPLSSRISRSRSPPPKRRSSRSPLPLRQRSRTPKRRSRSGSFSISRSRSYSRSQSRGSISRDRERDCDRDKNREREKDREYERDRDWDREPVVHYRSPVRSPLRFQRDRDRNRPRSRESREVYNSHYNDPLTNEYPVRDRNRERERERDRDRDRDRERDLISTRERPGSRYAPQSRSSQHNIPPLLPHLSSGAHPPPLMSLGAPQSERKDYYDSYNRYAEPPTQRYDNSPLREPHYKRFDDVAPPGTEGYYDVAPSGIDHPERSMKDDRDRSRMSKEEEDRERMKDLDINNHDRMPMRDERFRERDTRAREKEERDRRGIERGIERGNERDRARERDREREREKEREKDDRDRMIAFREREERAREKDERERREKEKERDLERYNKDRRDDNRPLERKEYDKERHRDDRDRYKLDDKIGRAREKERRDRDYEMERERQDRHERRSVERKKLKKSFSPHLQKQRNETKEFSPEKLRKKEKDYHEDKLDEKKKEKKVKDKKKKKDSEEKEKKKKKKKDRKVIQKEIVKTESSKSLSETDNSTVDVMIPKETESLSIKTQSDIESNNVQLVTNTNITTSFPHTIQYEEKSLIMNPEPPELSEEDSSRQVDAELNRNPPNPNFKPIPELESNVKPIDSLYSDLEDTEINPVITEKYSSLPNIESEHETNDENESKHDNADFITENDSKQTTTNEPETPNSDEKTITPPETLSNDSVAEGKSPKKDEFLAPMPELSKWERDDSTAEKLEENPVGLSSASTPTQDESKSTKLVTSEVLKRAENAIFQKAINAIRPIEIKKISDSRKVLYQNPEIKIGESDVNRETRKGVNVTINVGRNERNVEITEPLKKSKLDRSKFKTPSESHSPTRLSVRERLGEKVEDEKEKATTNVKPFLEKRDANKTEIFIKSRSPKSTKEKGPSPIMERAIELPQPISSTSSERKVFLDDRKRDRDKSDRTRDKNESRSEKRESKTEKDMDVSNIINFRANRVERIEKERERERGRDRDSGTSHTTIYKNEDTLKSSPLKRKKEDDDTEKKDEKKGRNEKKRKKEHRSRSKSKDRKKRKEKKHKKDKDRTQEKKLKHKNISGSRDNSQIKDDKHNVENMNFIGQSGQSTKKIRKISRIVMDRKRSALDEASFEPDYSASDSESDSENGKISSKKLKLSEQIDVGKELDVKSTKRRTKSSSDDDSSSSESSSTDSDSSEDSRKKRKKKHKKHKKRKSAKKDSSSDSDSDSASTDSSSDGEKHKKRSKKSKNKSKISKKKRKSKHK